MKSNNILLGYVLIGLQNTFFWYAVWLLYLFKFIDITQLVFLQAVGLVTSVIAEVPTGALSDLIGKKKTLQIAFLVTGLGEIALALSRDFPQFLMTWIVLNVGYSFFSGTMEAFIYDSLVEKGEEHKYSKVLSKTLVIENAVIGAASIIGGFLFNISFVLPFALTGLMKLIAFVFSCFIHEPAVDTDKFSFVNFIVQTKKGFIHLFRPELLRSTLLILLFGSFSLVAYEMLDDIAVVDWGFDGVQIGYIYAAATVLAMISSYLYEPISKKVRTGVLLAVGIGFLVLNYIFSPWISSTIWVGLFLTRCFYSSIRQGAISELLNRNTPSNIRATTISTYELIRKVPYVFLAGFIGVTMESIGVKWFSHYFVLALVVLLAVYILLHKVIFRNTAG